MCGILGAWQPGGIATSAVDSSLRAIEHRGPDDEGRFVEGDVLLAMRRLAIIDLAGGQQPIANEDQSVVVVFNGEIYNYRELAAELKSQGHLFRTESDTEVLVHLYEEHGTAMCGHLRGMFAFAIGTRAIAVCSWRATASARSRSSTP